MNVIRRIVLVALVAPAVLSGGCEQAPAPPDQKLATGAAAPKDQPLAAAPPADAAKPADTPKAASKYIPPFPQRDDLFQPPNAELAAQVVRATASSDVMLKGIVNFNGARALLQIDGQVVQVPAQGRHGSVQVVSIDPPNVTLRRGEKTWTASLRAEQ